MKKVKNVLALLLCAVLLISASVAGTIAYLTSQDSTTNTFTVGKVGITLKEYDVDPQTGLKKSPLTAVDNLTDLELVPGREVQKHPFVTVTENSEPCWLFVKVENGLAGYEAAGDTTIAKQLETNGWVKLENVDNVDNVYYYKDIVPTSAAAQVYTVFTSIKIADNAQSVDGWDDIAATNKVIVTAYAIQSEGFNTKDTAAANAADAWAALNPTNN